MDTGICVTEIIGLNPDAYPTLASIAHAQWRHLPLEPRDCVQMQWFFGMALNFGSTLSIRKEVAAAEFLMQQILPFTSGVLASYRSSDFWEIMTALSAILDDDRFVKYVRSAYERDLQIIRPGVERWLSIVSDSAIREPKCVHVWSVAPMMAEEMESSPTLASDPVPRC